MNNNWHHRLRFDFEKHIIRLEFIVCKQCLKEYSVDEIFKAIKDDEREHDILLSCNCKEGKIELFYN